MCFYESFFFFDKYLWCCRDLLDVIFDMGNMEIAFIDPLSQYCHADESN